MPYKITNKATGCDGFAVVKEGTSTPIKGGCHKTRAGALKHLVAIRIDYDEREQPRDADGKFGSGGGSSKSKSSAGKAGSKMKPAPGNVVSKGVNPKAEYVMSAKTGNVFKNPKYNGSKEGAGKWAENGQINGGPKPIVGKIDELDGGSKFQQTGSVKHQNKEGLGDNKPTTSKATPSVKFVAKTGKKSATGTVDSVKGNKKSADDTQALLLEQNRRTDAPKLHRDINKGQPPVNLVESSAISLYSGSEYQSINGDLRDTKGDLSATGKTAEILDGALSRRTIAKDVAAQRVIDRDTRNLKVGDEMYDPGFQSFTTSEQNDFSGETIIQTTIPKGTKGMSIRASSRHPSEDEILLPAGTTYRVTAIETGSFPNEMGYDASTRITVEIIGQGLRKGKKLEGVRKMQYGK